MELCSSSASSNHNHPPASSDCLFTGFSSNMEVKYQIRLEGRGNPRFRL